MHTNPSYDASLFLIGRTSDHENSGVGEGLIGRACRKIG